MFAPGTSSYASQSTSLAIVPQLPTTPLSRGPTPPGHLGSIEVAVFGIDRFYHGVLQTSVDTSLVREQRPDWNIRKFFDTANSVSGLASASRWTEAQRSYGEMLDHVIPLLYDRNPIVVVCVLQACSRFLQQGQGPVLQRFLSFLDRIACSRQMDSHPLRLMASAWAKSGEHALDIMKVCAQQSVDILTRTLGPDHAQTLSAERALYTAYYAKGDVVSALRTISSVEEKELRLYPYEYMTIDPVIRSLHCHLRLNDLDAAAKQIDVLDDYTFKLGQAGFPVDNLKKIKAQVGSIKGEYLRLRGESEATKTLQGALDLVEQLAGPQDVWLVCFLMEQLDLAKSAKEGVPPVPFAFPC